MRRPNAIPSQPLNVALPLPLYERLGQHLFSSLEQRVPHGAYSRFMVNLLQAYFSHEQLDLAPYSTVLPGTLQVQGSPEAIALLRTLLEHAPKVENKFLFTGSQDDFAQLEQLLGGPNV